MERSKLLAAAFLAGAFTLGATVGYGWDRTVNAVDGRPASERVGGRSAYDAFAADLGLSLAQRASVDSILDARHRTIDSLVAPIRPQIARVREDAQREIAARLTPAQRERYARYLERRRTQQPPDRSAHRGYDAPR